MPLFFLISGFCFSIRGYKLYLWKKTKRILIPYVIFTLLDMIPCALLGFLFNRPRDINESMRQMVFYGGAKWFLYVLFIIFLIYPLLFLVHRNNRKIMLTVEGALLVIAIMGIPVDIFRLGSVAYYVFYFHTGFLVRNFYPAIKERFKRIKNGSVILLSICLLALWIIFLSTLSGKARIVAAVTGIVTCYTLTRWDWFNKCFARFGKYSLQIYLLNGWMLGISRTLICNVLGISFTPVIIAANMIVDFGISYLLIKYVCERFKIVRYVMGMA